MQKIPTTNGLVALLKNGVIRYKDRDIVMVLVNGRRQPFYKSSGKSSKKKGQWLPFDGVKYPATPVEWFDKEAYVINPECPTEYHGFGELHRYGSTDNLEISQGLQQMSIPEGFPAETGMDVNFFLGVLDKYAPDHQRQAWARDKGWLVRGVHQKQGR